MLATVLATALLVSRPTAVATQAAEAPAQVMALPPELRARLKNEVIDRSSSQRERFNRLLHLVFDPGGLDLAYQPDSTLSVAQSYARHSINCLSFSMLFTAMAREAGLDAQPQEIRKTLAWRQDNNILYRVDHINTIVTIHGTGYLVDVLRDSVIHLEKPQPLSDRHLLARYYNNLSMHELEMGNLQPAMQNMEIALQLDPGYSVNWSNAGVVHARSGDIAAAHDAYARALAIEPNNASAMANMASLAEHEGDSGRAKELRSRLEKLNDIDPLYHFLQAELNEQSGDYPRAIEHYRKAIRLLGDEPRFYEALARAYLKSGDRQSAIRNLRRAMRWSNGQQRDEYRKQVDALRGA